MADMIKVNAEIRNLSDYAHEKDGFIVARRSDLDATLWFYGLYTTAERAQQVAIDIGNGVVLEKRTDNFREKCENVMKESCYLEQGITQC